MGNIDRNPPTGRDVAGTPDGDRLDSVGAIESFARTYLADDFPNPQRAGCLPRSKLIAAAQSARLPGDDLRTHLMRCSECFNEFRVARRTAATTKGATLLQRLTAAFTGLRAAAFAGAVLLALLAIVTVIALRHHSRTPADAGESSGAATDDAARAATNRPPNPPTPAIAGSASMNASPSSPTAKRPAATVAVNTGKIELDDYTALRGAGGHSGQDHKTITLDGSRYELTLALPEGSEAGHYRVSVEDEFGRTKVSAASSSTDGRLLRVVLDLSRLSPKSYMLCVAHRSDNGEEEPPRCYELRLSHTRPAPR